MLESNPNYSNVQVQELIFRPVPWSNGRNTCNELAVLGLTRSLDMNETERKLAETMQANILCILPAFKASILRDKTFPEEFVNELFEVRIFVSIFRLLLTP